MERIQKVTNIHDKIHKVKEINFESNTENDCRSEPK